MEENLDGLQTPILQEASVLSDVYENEAYYIQNNFSLIESDEIFQGTDHLTLRANMDLSLQSDEAVLPEWENFSLNIHRDTLSLFAEQSEAISICFTNPKMQLNEPLVGNYEGLSDLFKTDSFSNTLKNSFECEGNTIFGFPNSDIGQLNFGSKEFVAEGRLFNSGLDLANFSKSSLDELAPAPGVNFLKTGGDYITAQYFSNSSISLKDARDFKFFNKQKIGSQDAFFMDGEVKPKYLDLCSVDMHFDEEFIKMLSELNDDFVDIYKGACEANLVKLTDYKRHVSIGLRELISHTIRQLAPKNEVEKWLKKTGRIQKNMLTQKGPTRKGRIIYLFRNRSKTVRKLVEKETDAINQLYNLINKPIHSPKSGMPGNLLNNYIEKTKNLLKTILILLKN